MTELPPPPPSNHWKRPGTAPLTPGISRAASSAPSPSIKGEKESLASKYKGTLGAPTGGADKTPKAQQTQIPIEEALKTFNFMASSEEKIAIYVVSELRRIRLERAKLAKYPTEEQKAQALEKLESAYEPWSQIANYFKAKLTAEESSAVLKWLEAYKNMDRTAVNASMKDFMDREIYPRLAQSIAVLDEAGHKPQAMLLIDTLRDEAQRRKDKVERKISLDSAIQDVVWAVTYPKNPVTPVNVVLADGTKRINTVNVAQREVMENFLKAYYAEPTAIMAQLLHAGIKNGTHIVLANPLLVRATECRTRFGEELKVHAKPKVTESKITVEEKTPKAMLDEKISDIVAEAENDMQKAVILHAIVGSDAKKLMQVAWDKKVTDFEFGEQLGNSFFVKDQTLTREWSMNKGWMMKEKVRDLFEQVGKYKKFAVAYEEKLVELGIHKKDTKFYDFWLSVQPPGWEPDRNATHLVAEEPPKPKETLAERAVRLKKEQDDRKKNEAANAAYADHMEVWRKANAGTIIPPEEKKLLAALTNPDNVDRVGKYALTRLERQKFYEGVPWTDPSVAAIVTQIRSDFALMQSDISFSFIKTHIIKEFSTNKEAIDVFLEFENAFIEKLCPAIKKSDFGTAMALLEAEQKQLRQNETLQSAAFKRSAAGKYDQFQNNRLV